MGYVYCEGPLPSPGDCWSVYEEFSGSQAAGRNQRGGKDIFLPPYFPSLCVAEPVRPLFSFLLTICAHAGKLTAEWLASERFAAK